MITATLTSCSFFAAEGDTPALLIVKFTTPVDGKAWAREVRLSGVPAQELWDQYTSATEQSTIATLLAL